MTDNEKQQLRNEKKARGECICLHCSAKATYEGYCNNCHLNLDRRCI